MERMDEYGGGQMAPVASMQPERLAGGMNEEEALDMLYQTVFGQEEDDDEAAY